MCLCSEYDIPCGQQMPVTPPANADIEWELLDEAAMMQVAIRGTQQLLFLFIYSCFNFTRVLEFMIKVTIITVRQELG